MTDGANTSVTLSDRVGQKRVRLNTALVTHGGAGLWLHEGKGQRRGAYFKPTASRAFFLPDSKVKTSRTVGKSSRSTSLG